MTDDAHARARSGLNGILVALVAAIPFVPSVREFVARGIPDILFTGDGAVLELGTWRAAHAVQLVGPYSRFGWSHPGPAYFYLAAPFYLALGERGPALNVFALVTTCVAAAAIVLVALRLRGLVFALLTASFIAVFARVAAPFLLANEWNPILPILPLAALTFLAVAWAEGYAAALPMFVLTGSAIVQTHVGYTPEVLALFIMAAFFSPRGDRPDHRKRNRMAIAATAVAAACWALPLFEAATRHPGNLQLIARFFVPKHWAEHSWREATATVIDQLAVMPAAFLQAFRLVPATAGPAFNALLAIGEVLALLLLSLRAKDKSLAFFARVVLVEMVVAVLAVRAIRGAIEFYLIAWISVIGLLAFCVAAAWLTAALDRWPVAQAIAGAGAIAFTLLATTTPLARGAVVRDPDPDAEAIARAAEGYVDSGRAGEPTIRLGSRNAWSTAAAVVLDLTKRGARVFADDDLASIVGEAFAAPAGTRPSLFVGDRAFDDEVKGRTDLVLIARAGSLCLYAEPTAR